MNRGADTGVGCQGNLGAVIVITYAIVLHLRMVPKLKGAFLFNAASVIGFGSVIMTFVGVNYYLSKGMHSYAADENLSSRSGAG